jgi:hypothetical protein
VEANELKARFEAIKKEVRRGVPDRVFSLVGELGLDVLHLLKRDYEQVPFDWKGKGAKKYTVYVQEGQSSPFSRAANTALFIPDPEAFARAWQQVTEGLERGRKSAGWTALCEPLVIDQALYTAVISFASVVDLDSPGDKGTPGALFEMAVGAAISWLTGLQENGQVKLGIPSNPATLIVKADTEVSEPDATSDVGCDLATEEEAEEEDAVVTGQSVTIKADRWFKGESHDLIVALKISTRERISQVSVQQRILESIKPGGFHSILCACNENNVLAPKGTRKADRSYDSCWLVDTLVPGTIALYHKFVAPLEGIYYLDPPTSYLSGTYQGLPPVRRFRDLLVADLPKLLGASPKSVS